MKNCVTIRRIEEKDKTEYLSLFEQESFGCIGMLSEQKPSIYTEERVLNKVISKEALDIEILIIEDELGFIGYTLVSQTSRNQFHIGEFVIAPTRRKEGFGSILLNEVIRYATLDKANINLECFSSATTFFKKMGFRHVHGYNYSMDYNPNNITHKEHLFPPYELIEEERNKMRAQENERFKQFLKSPVFKSIMDL